MKKFVISFLILLSFSTLAAFAVPPNPTATPTLWGSATQRGYAETKANRYNLFYGPMGFNSPLWIGDPSVGSSFDSLLFIDTEPAGVEYSIYVASSLPITFNGDLTVAPEATGGDQGARNYIKGRFGVSLVSLGVGTNGSAGTMLLLDDSPTGEWSAVDASVVVSANTGHYKSGANSMGLAFASGAAATDGALAAVAGTPDWTASESLGFWIYSDTALASGDLTLLIADATADTTISIPAITANSWQWVELDISALTGTTGDVVTSVKVLLSTQGATSLGAFNVYFDGVYKWESTDEEELGSSVAYDGVLNVLQTGSVDANTGTHAFGNLSEYTDYFVNYGASNEQIVWITDMSTKSSIALIAFE